MDCVGVFVLAVVISGPSGRVRIEFDSIGNVFVFSEDRKYSASIEGAAESGVLWGWKNDQLIPWSMPKDLLNGIKRYLDQI